MGCPNIECILLTPTFLFLTHFLAFFVFCAAFTTCDLPCSCHFPFLNQTIHIFIHQINITNKKIRKIFLLYSYSSNTRRTPPSVAYINLLFLISTKPASVNFSTLKKLSINQVCIWFTPIWYWFLIHHHFKNTCIFFVPFWIYPVWDLTKHSY